MSGKMIKRSRAQKGQSLLEFALIIPVLSLIFMGVFDFGWILHRQITLDNATRAAARRGAVGETTPVLRQMIKDSVYFDILDDQIAIRVLDENGVDIGDPDDRTPDNYIEVEVTLNDVELITPLRNLAESVGTINLVSTAQFLIE